ncbi:MAG TPA: HEAT repeat domain-containing protein [Candidatus Acidoferrum sp.]|nr:HEAT repeat domain-containing protein [Candidatus Acidoferrum sp.]
MEFILKMLPQFNRAFFLTGAIFAFGGGAVILMVFLTVRRAVRHFRIQRFDELANKVHKQWREIVRGEIPSEAWRRDSMQCEIIQSIVIQEIGAATDKDRAGLQEFLRENGLVNTCIEKVQAGRGWARRRAILALGAMRVPEAIPPLSEALDDWQLDTRMAAVQALGRTFLPEAGEPIIESFMVGGLKVPPDPISNALVRCFINRPEAMIPFLRRSQGEPRELLARVASELATPAMADEMLILAADPRPEVRASAAKALSVAPLQLSIPALADLARDEIWFVRLRAAIALNEIPHPRTIPILLEAVRDSNRLVRIRAASALTKFQQETVEILQNIIDSRDRYALHAMISALELGGGFGKVLAELEDPMLHDQTARQLLEALREGAAGLWSTRPADPVVESVFP